VTPSVEYSRRLYDDVLGWYRTADAKAQAVLGLDAAFVAFMTANAFQKPIDLGNLLSTLSPRTSRLLGLMAATLAASMASSIYCLVSRIYLRPHAAVRKMLAKSKAWSGEKYPAGVMWFFQFVSVLDPAVFRQTLIGVDEPFEVDALASQISILSKNVRKKHIAANVGFVLAVVTVLLFAASAASYVAAIPRSR
jgi:hypothetical protein